jgi:protein involved in polysaccharide export with SLBB domain
MTLAGLIAEAQGLLPYALPDRVKVFRPVAATGRIEQISLDLAADGLFELREFDRVEILDARVGYPGGQITLTGAVHTVGTRPFIENQTVADALHLAGGLREDAIEIEIATRRLGLTYSDTLVRTQVIRLTSLGSIPAEAHSIRLGRDDQIHVRGAPGYRDPQTVEVAGLFASPGVYPLRYEGEPISEIINRAGGALPNAFPPTFRVMRDDVPIVVEFEKAVRRDRAHDVKLRGGDRIVIGPDPGTVAVTGEVIRPAVFPYVRGWSVGDYVNAAGGKTPSADRSRTSIEYASGATFTTQRFGGGWRRPRIEPGVVIRVLARDSKSPLEKATEAVGNVTSQAGTAIMTVLGVRAIIPN